MFKHYWEAISTSQFCFLLCWLHKWRKERRKKRKEGRKEGKKSFLSYPLETETYFPLILASFRIHFNWTIFGYEYIYNWEDERLNMPISRPDSHATTEYGGHCGQKPHALRLGIDLEWEAFPKQNRMKQNNTTQHIENVRTGRSQSSHVYFG